MTLQKSYNKGNAIFAHTLKKNLPVILIATIISLFITPINPLLNMEKNDFKSLWIYGVGDFIVVWGISVIVAVILSIVNLNYFHSKKASDMFMSLPISRSSLLFNRVMATTVGSLIPMWSSFIIFLTICLPAGMQFEYVLHLIISLAILSIINFCLVFIGAFFMMISGRTFDAAIAFGAFSFGFCILAELILSMVKGGLFGFAIGADSFLISFSPIITFMAFGGKCLLSNPIVAREYNGEYTFSYDIEMLFNTEFLVPAIVWLVISIVIFALALILVKHRKTEAAGDSYAFKVVPILTQGIFSMLIAYVVSNMISAEGVFAFILYAIFGGVIASVIIGAVIDRGFKKTVKNIIIGAICSALLLGTGLSIKYDIFGYETFVPSLDDIQDVTVLNGSDNRNVRYFITSTYTDKEDISNVIAFHNDIINSEQYNGYHYGESEKYAIQYTLKNGHTVYRKYEVSTLVDNTAKMQLIKNKNFMNNYNIEFLDQFSVNVSNYEETYSGQGGKDWYVKHEEAKKVLEAYIKDLRNGAGESEKFEDLPHYLIRFYSKDVTFSDKLQNRFEPYDSETYRLIPLEWVVITEEFKNTYKALSEIGADTSNLIETDL